MGMRVSRLKIRRIIWSIYIITWLQERPSAIARCRVRQLSTYTTPCLGKVVHVKGFPIATDTEVQPYEMKWMISIMRVWYECQRAS